MTNEMFHDVSPDDAEALGAFEEDALGEADVLGSLDDDFAWLDGSSGTPDQQRGPL